MKKLLFILVSALFIGCSSGDDDIVAQGDSQYFHPPNWIQGTWNVSGTSSAYFKFTNNDFILMTPYTSYKSVMEQSAATGQSAKVDETISDTNYQFSMTAGISYGTYKFVKISPTRIQWVSSGSPVYFDKQ